ncbi:MAG: DUF2079 domain-containing protein, partial [Oscillatoriales cyanobacterium RM1_1_9]|nr:DUF2079 domain-containing protein [Oscillatoriales cyanobacterium RM1_1_9]
HIDTVSATRAAISLVSTQGSVLTADQITSHLTHRSIVMLATLDTELQNLSQFKYILLNRSYPGWGSSPEFVSELIQELKSVPQFELLYQRDGVFLFVQQSRKGLGKSDLNMK